GPLADAVNGSSIFSLGTRSILMPEVDILKTSPLMTPAAESVMVRKRIGRTGHHVARVFDRFEQGTAPRRQARYRRRIRHDGPSAAGDGGGGLGKDEAPCPWGCTSCRQWS